MDDFKLWLNSVGYLTEEVVEFSGEVWKVWRSRIDNSFLTADWGEDMYEKYCTLYHVWKRHPRLEKVQSGGSGRTANIGFDPEENKWCGWSHRAIVCFGIGDKLFEEDFGNEDTLFTDHGSKIITSLEEAKKSAIRFAEYVA